MLSSVPALPLSPFSMMTVMLILKYIHYIRYLSLVFCDSVHLCCICIFNSVLNYVVVDNVSMYSCLINVMLCIELVYFPFTVVTVGFELTNYTVMESETATNVCVVFTGEIERMLDVMIFTPNTSSGK